MFNMEKRYRNKIIIIIIISVDAMTAAGGMDALKALHSLGLGGETTGPEGDKLLKQAQHVWSMLDDMAAKDPQAYARFIEKQKKEYHDLRAPPEPHMCVKTELQVQVRFSHFSGVFVCLFLGCLVALQHAKSILRMDLHEQFYVLPCWDRSYESDLLSWPVIRMLSQPVLVLNLHHPTCVKVATGMAMLSHLCQR